VKVNKCTLTVQSCQFVDGGFIYMSCDQRVQALTNYNTEHSVELMPFCRHCKSLSVVGSSKDPHFVFIQFLFSKSCFPGWVQVQNIVLCKVCTYDSVILVSVLKNKLPE
jgi:hypothetical protein